MKNLKFSADLTDGTRETYDGPDAAAAGVQLTAAEAVGVRAISFNFTNAADDGNRSFTRSFNLEFDDSDLGDAILADAHSWLSENS